MAHTYLADAFNLLGGHIYGGAPRAELLTE